ncbi:hypothetical protein [Roseimaritima sediminicola]|uniref:hypothetical protein n=1 Tax=Roseimaritima sediminicola TaxID=2662066 RepID=UPI0012982CF6|nr:hypothetical protein [Roseimaritima sediminicola]
MRQQSLRRIGLLGIAMLWMATAAAPLEAGPPLVAEESGSSTWMTPLSPTTWKLPALPWSSSEKKPAARTSSEPGLFTSMSRQLGRGWEKTKQTLNPKNLMPKDEPTRTARRRKAEPQEERFWSGWFAANEEPQKIETINDFLRQPLPY